MAIEQLLNRSIPQLLDDVREHVPLEADTVTLVHVEHPLTAQRVLGVRRLDVPASYDGTQMDLSDLLCREARELVPDPRPRDHTQAITTIICRYGRNVWTDVETTWSMGWRYSNHFTAAMDLDTVVVTEHGWASMLCETGGHEPRLLSA